MNRRYDRRAASRPCAYCRKSFQPTVDQLRRGVGKFCSRGCKDTGMSRPLAERFWAKVQKTGGCWLWTGGLSGAGYGLMVDGRGEQQRRGSDLETRDQNVHGDHHAVSFECAR